MIVFIFKNKFQQLKYDSFKKNGESVIYDQIYSFEKLNY